MESYRKRVLTARLLLAAGGLLVLAALLPPWMIFQMSKLAGSYGTAVSDVTIRLWEVLRENAVNASHDFFGSGLKSAFALLVWIAVFVFLLSSPFLARFYSQARALLWVARGMAVALCVPLMIVIYVMDRSGLYIFGPGIWLFQTAAIIHALGLFLIPKLPPAVEPALPES